MDDECIETLFSLTAGKYSMAKVQAALKQADGDIDDALALLQQEERPTSMFSEGVVSKRTKQTVDEQRANSKFDGLYSKKKRTLNNQGLVKSHKLQEAEEKLNGLDYFSTVMLLQNRETADSDLSRVNEQAPQGSMSVDDDLDGDDTNPSSKDANSLQSKIEVALDIFNNSTSREYLISLQRFHRAQQGGRREQLISGGSGGFGLVNLAETRKLAAPNLNAQGGSK